MLRMATRSIRDKFAMVVLAATLAALTVTGLAMVAYDVRTYQRTGIGDLVAQGEILMRASAPALDFEDRKAASQYLELLKAKPEISVAAIYDAQGDIFATYTRPDSDPAIPDSPAADGARIEGKDIRLFKRIERNDVTLGTVYIKADYELRRRLIDYLGIFGFVAILGLFVALVLSNWLQGVFLRPILATSAIARRLVETRDYSLRVSKTSSDEIGDLVDAFNDMVAEVGRRSTDLEASNKRLAHEMSERKEAEQRIRAQLGHLQLLDHITRSTGERLDLNSIFQIVLVRLEDSVQIDFACVCLLDSTNEALRVACVGPKSELVARQLEMLEDAVIDVDKNGLGKCVRGDLVYEPDIGQSTFPFPSRLARGGLSSLVLAPLRSENRVFGVLIAARRSSSAFASVECEFLRQLSEHVALAAHQAKLYGDLQKAYDDLNQTQQAVMQQERLRALGQMASGIAHDINNALSPVSLYTESMLETESNLSERARGYLETIQRAVEDVAQTVARMREFYRQREVQADLAPLDANLLVRQVIDLTKARWSDMAQDRGVVIQPRLELNVDLPMIMGVENEIREALTNLVFNAVDAMSEGGTLTLRTTLQSGSDRGAVVIEVVDSGSGMDENTRQRCLEPFFTTKGERGTGLGLAMVFGMVQRHNAQLEIESTPGTGTTIALVFPIATGAIEQTDKPPVSDIPKGLRLLVIDDDPLLIRSLRDALATDDHDVTAANGGEAGIAEFTASLRREERYAAVITDLGMPYMDGRRVAAAVKQLSPATPVILLTGWGRRILSEGDTPDHVDQVLAKPPKLRELREALGRLCRSQLAKELP